MRYLFCLALLLSPAIAVAQDTRNPDSPDFDPVARMQRFFPGWQPPVVSQDELSEFPLGSAQRPVRTQGPSGQREYLGRLVCPGGEAPGFQRRGSIGESPYGFPMDVYEVRCKGQAEQAVYMDLYHPRFVEKETVPGFTLKDQQPD